jgi:23S rRNA A2030 N6-methylase RlmJ
MYGSGMLLLNCPYQVDEAVSHAMREVSEIANISSDDKPIQSFWHKPSE